MGACGSTPEAAVALDAVHANVSATHTALFFPDAAFPCRAYARGAECRRKNCQFAHHETSLGRMLAVLSGARQTIEVCVFTITCNEIADALEAAAKRGVMVRVITDDEQARSLGSDVARLARLPNVTVRHDGDAGSHMHHKFAIVDGTALLNGSFNWTRSAVLTNRENVVLTRGAPELIGAFRDEFNAMWTAYANNTRIPPPSK